MESLRATEPLHVGGVILIAVHHIRVEQWRGPGGVYLHAFSEPSSIVALDEGRWRAFDKHGVEVAVEPILAEVPGLADTVERLR